MTLPTDSNRWRALHAVSIALIIVGIDSTILNVALPSIARDLHAASSDLVWINASYIIMYGSTILLSGTLGDRFGRKRLLLSGMMIFMGGSIWSGLAASPQLLIVGRLIQGVGGGMLTPVTLSLVTAIFPDAVERAKAIGAWAAMMGVGIALGPILGGLLLTWFPWGSVFFVNVPVVIAGLIAITLCVPESKDANASAIDGWGAILSTVGMFALFFFLIEGPERGFASPASLGALALAVALLASFVVVELRLKQPMLDLRFFQNMKFSSGVLAIAITYFAQMGLMYELTLYLQSVRGLKPLLAGSLLLPFAICLFIGSRRAPELVSKIGERKVVVGGQLLAGVGFALFFLLGDSRGYGLVVAGMSLAALGVAFVGPPASNAIMSSVPPEKAGIGAATNSMMRQIGGSLGIAIIGGVGQLVYANTLSASDAYQSLPAHAAALAHTGITRANELAEQLGSAGAPLQAAAAVAYIHGMHLAMVVAVVAVLSAALLVTAMLAPAPTPR